MDYTTQISLTQYPLLKEANCDSFICFLPTAPEVDYEKWQEYLQNNLILDSASLDTIPAGKYTVLVQFAIVARGKIDEILILKDPGFGLGKRVKDIFTNYKARHNVFQLFESAKSYLRQPITFIIEDEKECDELLTPEIIF